MECGPQNWGKLKTPNPSTCFLPLPWKPWRPYVPDGMVTPRCDMSEKKTLILLDRQDFRVYLVWEYHQLPGWLANKLPSMHYLSFLSQVLLILLCEVKWKSLSRVQLFVTPWTWNSLGQNTGVDSLSLLQGIFPTQRLNPGLLHCKWILYQLRRREVQEYWSG